MRPKYAAARSDLKLPCPRASIAEPVELHCELGLVSIRLAEAGRTE